MLHMLSAVLKHDGFDPECAASAQDALELAVRQDYDFILSDVRMPGMDGIQLVEALRAKGVDAIVILMSAYGTIELALEAIRKGAYDYISKPFKTDEVVLTLRKAAERERLRREVVRLRKRLLRAEGDTEIVAESEAMKAILDRAHAVAPFDSSVLITGESGTGKEVVAREIHRRSTRANGPFIAINCGAIPDGLLQSEFFGHARGAFTGASEDKPGLFEEADGGSIFLDEIACMDDSLQVKLLRVLDRGEIRRVGETTLRSVSVRILAATNEDVDEALESGRLRTDLFYRLNVMHIHIPPLAERKEDIVPLVEHFVQLFNRKLGAQVRQISREARKALLNYHWKGNVRELQNVVERALILTSGDSIALESLPYEIRTGATRVPALPMAADSLSLKKAYRDVEKTLITRALNRTGGNRSRAASLLEISYPALLQKIKEYGLL
jgi:two-component system response regulator AtoC